MLNIKFLYFAGDNRDALSSGDNKLLQHANLAQALYRWHRNRKKAVATCSNMVKYYYLQFVADTWTVIYHGPVLCNNITSLCGRMNSVSQCNDIIDGQNIIKSEKIVIFFYI